MKGKKMKQDLLSRIIKHEGLRLKPYRCTADKLTIGVGRNLDDNGITEAEALILLGNDLERCHIECINSFPWYVDLDETRQGIVLEMCFNLGLNRLKGFKKMLAAMALRNYALASQEMMMSAWALQVGQRSRTLSECMRRGV